MRSRRLVTLPSLTLASIKFLRGQRRLSENDAINSVRGYDVFLSQLTQDNDVTVELTAAFSEKFGLQVFSSATFSPGDEWCVICVLVGERTSQQASVLDELDAALNANSTIRIIPVLVGNATPDDLRPRLRPFQWVDLTQGDRENTIAELASLSGG